MGTGGEYAGADYQRTGFPAGTGADSKPPQKVQGWYDADFFRLVKCADCGWSLSYGENRQNSKAYGHYHCSKYGQGTRQCSMHYIRYDVLYAYVLSRLQIGRAHV